MEQSSNLPMLLGVGAIAFAALAAGLAAGPYFAARANGPQLPPGVVAPGNGGIELPAADDGAPAADPPEGALPLTEDERLGDLLADMIDGFGKLKRRVDTLERAPGATGDDGGSATRLDPKTGQEYRAVTVWVPEGLEDEASEFLREVVLDALFHRNAFKVPGEPFTLLDATMANGPDALRPWGPLVRDFGAAWSGRGVGKIDEFVALLNAHLDPFLQVAEVERQRDPHPQAWTWPGPHTPPAAGTDLRAAYDQMQAALRTDWRAFVESLPFDVQANYRSWCSPFLAAK